MNPRPIGCSLAFALCIFSLGLGGCKRPSRAADAGATTTIDWRARWQQVEAWAKPAISAAPATLLEESLFEVSRIRGTLLRLRVEYFRRREPLPMRSVKDFPPEAKQALEKFLGWYRTKGGLPKRQDVVDYMALTYLAVLTASGASTDPQLEAVLYLAHRLREEGEGLLPVSAGAIFSDHAIRRVREQGGGPGPAFDRFRPSEGHVFRALASEAKRALGLASRLGGGKRGKAIVGGRGSTAYVAGAVEQVRRYWAQFLFDLKPLLGSPARLDAFLGEHDRQARKHPQPLVRMVSIAARKPVQRLLENRQRYLAFLGSKRPTSRATRDGGTGTLPRRRPKPAAP